MNPFIAGIEPSLIRSIHAAKRPGDLDLGLGEPTLRPDPGLFDRASGWVRENGCPYSPNAGFPELRERIAAYVLGAGAPMDRACVTVGSEEALYLAIKTVIDPVRDEVLVVEPSYLAYGKICVLEGVRHRAVRLDPEEGFRPRAETVLGALRSETRLVVLNTPGNPTGRVWPEAELRALAEGLRGRPGAPTYVLSDEVYREIHFGDSPPPSISAWHPLSLVAGSLSKSSALTGLRLGWLVGPPDVIEGAVKVHQFVNTAASTFSQRVALELFREAGALSAHLPEYRARRDALLEAAQSSGVELIPPEGAFYALARLPAPLASDSVVAAMRLLESKRVVAVPGRAFGEGAEGWLRLSWAGSTGTIAEGVERLGEFFREV